MTLLRGKLVQFALALLLVLAWSVLRNIGTSVTSGQVVASPEFTKTGDDLVTTSAVPGAPTLTQSLNLEANHFYVVQFDVASSREAKIEAGFAAGPTFVPGGSFTLDLDQSGGPIRARYILNSGPAPQGLLLKIKTSGARVLIRNISVRVRSLLWTLAAWLALASAAEVFGLLAFHLVGRFRGRLRFPTTVSWAWPVITVISALCLLRNLALPRPFVFGDEFIYALLSKFAGREGLLLFDSLTTYFPNILYFHLYQAVFHFDDNYLEAAKILNIFFLALALAIFYATIRLFQTRNIALLAVVVSGLGGVGVYTACLMPETLYFCLFSIIVYFFVRYIYTQPLLASALCGLCLAAEILVKPHGLILIAPWLIALVLLRRPWRQTLRMAGSFIVSLALGVAALNLILTGELTFGLGGAYGPIAARSASSGSLDRILGLMGTHLAALSTLYALPLIVALCYLLQPKPEPSEKAIQLRTLLLFIVSCLITLLFTTAKFTTLWPSTEPEASRIFVRYYSFLLPWLVGAFFCAWPELDWSKPMVRHLFRALGVALGGLALVATVSFGASHTLTFVDFPDIFWFYTQPTTSRFFVAAIMAALTTVYLVRRPGSWLFGLGFGLLSVTGTIWMSRYLLVLPPTPGDVAAATFRPLIKPETLDRGLVIVPNGSDVDSYRLLFHMLGAYDVARLDPRSVLLDSPMSDRPWIITAGSIPVNFYFQQAISMGRFTLYLLPGGSSQQYTYTPAPQIDATEQILNTSQPFAHIDILGHSITDKPVVSAGTPMEVSGWAFDPKQDRPAGRVVVVIDGKPFSAAYGQDRPDVAQALNKPQVNSSGFKAVIPPDALERGPHEVAIRVVSRDPHVYWTGTRIKFTVK